MTLIDLQGKLLHVGSKAVQKAYLGEELFYGESKMYDIEPRLAIRAVDNAMYAYAGNMDDFMNVSHKGTQTVTPNGLFFNGSDGYWLAPKAYGTTEITIKNPITDTEGGNRFRYATIISIGDNSFSSSGAPIDIGYTLDAGYSLRGDNTISRASVPFPDTEYVTFAIQYSYSSGKIGATVYINGDLRWNVSTVSSSSTLKTPNMTLIGASANREYKSYNGNNRWGMFYMVDLKLYEEKLTAAEIKKSYEYVANTL